jgi:hypothetical protein
MNAAFRSPTWWTGLVLAGVGSVFWVLALEWETDRKIFPLFGAGFLILFAAIHTVVGLLRGIEVKVEQIIAADSQSLSRDRAKYFLWVFGFFGLLVLLGHRIGVPAFIIFFMISSGERWLIALLSAFVMWAFVFLILENTVNILFPTGYLFRWLGL